MASAYPTSVDNETPLVDGTDKIRAATSINLAFLDETATQTFIGASGAAQSHNVDILTYLAYQKAPQIAYNSTTSFDILAGDVVVKNAGGTIKKLRRNTGTVNVTASNLDTGVMAVGYYYVYAIGDAAATTFTIKFSATANAAPSGTTNYEMIAWFYNETISVLDVTSKMFGNVKTNGRDVPNAITRSSATQVNTTGTSFGDDAQATMKFYSSGRPLLISYNVAAGFSSNDRLVVGLSIDASDVTNTQRKSPQGATTTTDIYGVSIQYVTTIAAGTHTIQGRYYVTANTGYINYRELSIIEL